MTKKHAELILILSFLLLFSGCVTVVDSSTRRPAPAPVPAQVKKAPPPWAPAHGYRAKYNYKYYPSNSIYYDTGRRIYFYYRNGSWSASVSLPVGITLRVDDFVTLEMDTDTPYTHHREIRKKYPPGQQKKINKGRDNKYSAIDRDKNRPAHANRVKKYNYKYYPSRGIYYDTGRRLYFYNRNGVWARSASLPAGLKPGVDDSVDIEMDTDRPYLKHNDIKKKYPHLAQKKNFERKENKESKNIYKDKGRDKVKPVSAAGVRYSYRYYPSSEIYFDTGRKLYFYYSNKSWHASVALPRGIKISVDDFVDLEMDNDKPYINHADVKKKHPPAKQKKIIKEKPKTRLNLWKSVKEK